MSIPFSTATLQEVSTYLSARLLEVPRLQEVLKLVSHELSWSNPSYFPMARVYITKPGPRFEDPFEDRTYYQIGAKVTYFDSTGQQVSWGQIIRVTTFEHSLLERCILILAEGLADNILERAAEKLEAAKPLPTRPLTPESRARLELPF